MRRLRARRRFLFSLRWCCLLLPFVFSVPAVSADVTISIVCLLSDPSTFPVAVYDTFLQRMSNSTFVSPTVTRADSITGAEAMQRYFAGTNVPFRRFELIHVTRVRSVAASGGNITAGRLQLGLRALAAGVGVCGVDDVVDSSALLQPSSDQQWLTSMPALVAPIALAGWLVTLLSCAVCWVCVCCTADKRVETVVQATVVGGAEQSAGAPTGVPVSVTQSAPVKDVRPNATGKAAPPKKLGTSSMFPSLSDVSQTAPPLPLIPPLRPSTPTMPLNTAVEFHRHHNSPHLLQLRIPSFSAALGTNTTT
jgi:hypothetical protein